MTAFIIGIGGGSAAGKSFVAEYLREQLAPRRVEVINQDRYFHEPQRLPGHASSDGTRTWPDYNHPRSFDFRRLRSDLRRARESAADVIIVEGILVLHDPELRKLMDLKLFVDADADERVIRRIRRNLAAGHDLNEICDFYLDSVRHRHRQFCQPTRVRADLVIPGGRDERAEAERLLSDVCQRVSARIAEGPRYAPGTRADAEGRGASH
jgi:uridine kinase